MKCPNCGEMVVKNKKQIINFCGFCGTNLRTGEKAYIPNLSNDSNDSVSQAPATSFPPNEPIKNNSAAPSPSIQKPFDPYAFTNNQNAPSQPSVQLNLNNDNNMKESEKAPAPAPVPSFGAFTPNGPIPQGAPVPSIDKTSEPVQNTPATPNPTPAPAPVPSFGAFTPNGPVPQGAPVPSINKAPEPVQNTPVTPNPTPAPAPVPSFGAFTPNGPVPQGAPVPSINKAPEPVQKDNQKTVKAPSFGAFTPNGPIPQGAPIPTADKSKSFEEDSKEEFEKIDKQLSELKFGASLVNKKEEKAEDANITFTQYTKGDTKETEPVKPSEPENKFASFAFGNPADKKEENKDIPEVADIEKEEESKNNFGYMNYIGGGQTSFQSNNDKTAPVKTSLVKEKDEPKSKLPETQAVPEAPKESAPEPVSPPEPPKEKVINYVGQEKSTAENTLKLKGFKVETVYITDEQEYDTVISQSIPADSEVNPGAAITLTISAGTWSEWSEKSIPVSASKYITESKTEYRKRSRTRTTDKRETTDTAEFEDYKLVDTVYKYSDWEVDQYYTSDVLPLGDTCEIIKNLTGFKYAGWFNPANILGMSYSSPDVANFFNTHLKNVKWLYEEVISPINVKPDVKNWKLVSDNMTDTPAGDPLTSNIFFSVYSVDSRAYAMKFGSLETEWYIYKRRNLEETVYYFEKEIISDWSEWSDWCETEFKASDDCEVEKRTLTRSRRKTTSEM